MNPLKRDDVQKTSHLRDVICPRVPWSMKKFLATSPEKVFAALHTPRAICQWWSATQAIVVAKAGGFYHVIWGDKNDPTYYSGAKITAFSSPHSMVLADYQYYAKDGKTPIDADFVVTFEVHPHPEGALLRIVHDGFPPGSEDFFTACVQGWADTCAGIQRYLCPPADQAP